MKQCVFCGKKRRCGFDLVKGEETYYYCVKCYGFLLETALQKQQDEALNKMPNEDSLAIAKIFYDRYWIIPKTTHS